MVRPPIAANIKREALLSSALFRLMRSVEIDEILGFATERRFPRTPPFAESDCRAGTGAQS
jgi:hypothetical protein